MKPRVTVLAASLLTAGYSLPAGAQATTASLMGAGANSCGTWLDQRSNLMAGKTPSAVLTGESQWVLGFVGGFNAGVRPDVNLTGSAKGSELMFYIDNYCRSHPLAELAEAASAMVADLTKKAAAQTH